MTETKDGVRQLIEDVKTIPSDQRQHLIRHDIKAVFDSTGIALSLIKDRYEPSIDDDSDNSIILPPNDPFKRSPSQGSQMLAYQMRICQHIVHITSTIPLEDILDDELRKATISVPDKLSIAPVLKAEASFLKKPTEQAYYDLLAQRTGVNNILRNFDMQPVLEDRTVDGSTAIKLINVAGNAKKYHRRTPSVDTEVIVNMPEPDRVEIINLSTRPLPDNPFGLGVIGPSGNRGLGLYLVDVFGRADGAEVQLECNPTRVCYERLFEIKASVPLIEAA